MDKISLQVAPANPDLVIMVLTQQALLVLGWLIGVLVRRILRGRARISSSTATLTGLVGLWFGLIVSAWLYNEDQQWRFEMISTASLIAIVVVVVVALVITWFNQDPPLAPIDEVARGGESDRLEFKSTARWNLHTEKRDEAMETVIAKTVSAFLNSGGGTLLIGVDDDGRLIGLERDYSTLKKPDADRFELWIRDMWDQRMGTNAAALPRLDFAPAADGIGEVCRVTIPPSPRPVYLLGPKGKGAPELWVRVGNSTRKLELDDAVTYVSHRWPTTVRPGIRARLGTFLLQKRGGGLPSPLPLSVARALPGSWLDSVAAAKENHDQTSD